MKPPILAMTTTLFLLLAGCQTAGPSKGFTDITPAQLSMLLEAKDFFFVNTHVPYEGEIAETDAFIPYDQIESYASELPSDKDAKIVIYCRSGRMSEIAAAELVQRGYTQVFELDGGMIAWEGIGLPLVHK
jgi:rhodanese-related sulfurtransferase